MKWISMLWSIGNDVQQKGWYASKTVWVNILSFVAALIALKGYNIDANDVALVASGIAAAGNIVLRFLSSTPVGVVTVPHEGGVGVSTGSYRAGNDGAP